MAVKLSKETERRVNLAKESAGKVILAKGLQTQISKVKFILDISGSMDDLLRSGYVQEVCERVLGLAMNFDDDGEAEVYPFHHSAWRHPEPMKLDNIEEFVKREILSKYSLGGTNYAPFIKLLLEEEGFQTKTERSGGGLLGGLKSLFGGSKSVEVNEVQKKADVPTYAIVITDGDNSDKHEAELAIKQASYHGVFWQFIGIGNAGFSFLKKLDDMDGRFIDNANFFQANDLRKIDNKELYDRMLSEYPAWLTLARSKGIIA